MKQSNLFIFSLVSAITINKIAFASAVTDFSSVVDTFEAPMKTLVISAVIKIWGIIAIVLLGHTCWQGYQKRITMDEVTSKAMWIAAIGFIPYIVTILIEIGTSAG